MVNFNLRVFCQNLICFLVELGFELGFTLGKQACYLISHTSTHSALVILEKGSCELFAHIGLEPPFSRS
jgi:hypothetical protein